MALVRKMGLFWVFVALVTCIGCLSVYNTDWISIYFPVLGEMRIRAAWALLWAFGLGCTFTFFFFAWDFAVKAALIRGLRKRLRNIEANQSESMGEAQTKEKVEGDAPHSGSLSAPTPESNTPSS